MHSDFLQLKSCSADHSNAMKTKHQTQKQQAWLKDKKPTKPKLTTNDHIGIVTNKKNQTDYRRLLSNYMLHW